MSLELTSRSVSLTLILVEKTSFFLISSIRELVLDVCVEVVERHGLGILLRFLILLLFVGLVGVAP